MKSIDSKEVRKTLVYKDRRIKNDSSYHLEHWDKRNDHYELVRVDTPHLLKIFGKLRHEVYIEEERMPVKELSTIVSSIDNIELDEYDDFSEHFLLNFKPLDLFIGGVRLILPDASKPLFGIRPLQLSKDLLKAIGEENASKTFEISRILISKERLRIAQNKLKAMKRPTQILPIMHLFKPIYWAYKEKKLLYAAIISKKSLIKRLKAEGLHTISIGSEIQYNGSIQPSFLNLNSEYKRLLLENPMLLEFLAQ